MLTIILGGAPDANWMPFLLPLISIVAIVIGVNYLFRFIRNKKAAKY